MRIDERCDQTWETMPLVGEGRHCERCDHAVLDMTRATRAQAEALLRTRDRVCVRARVQDNGELRFQPPPPSYTRRFVGGLVLAAGLQACSSSPGAPTEVEVVNEAPLEAPMMPAAAALIPLPAAEPTLPTGPVPAELVQLAQADGPSTEQRQLTARKQARIAQNQVAAQPQHHPMAMGMMVGPSAY